MKNRWTTKKYSLEERFLFALFHQSYLFQLEMKLFNLRFFGKIPKAFTLRENLSFGFNSKSNRFLDTTNDQINSNSKEYSGIWKNTNKMLFIIKRIFAEKKLKSAVKKIFYNFVFFYYVCMWVHWKVLKPIHATQYSNVWSLKSWFGSGERKKKRKKMKETEICPHNSFHIG